MKNIFSQILDEIPRRVPAFAGLKISLDSKTLMSFLSRKHVLLTLVFPLVLLCVMALSPLLAVSESNYLVLRSSEENLLIPDYDEEILWFARLIYSETKDVNEQVLIAWVARNRVETGFRGTTYKEVALSASQFSGLNSFDHNYHHNISLNYGDNAEGWRTAVEVAKIVYDAPDILRPFNTSVRHFYSPIAVRAPSWASGKEAVHTIVDPRTGGTRFAFYADVR